MGVLLYLLGGDEKQLLVPLLFLALSSSYSYPLIFQNTAFFFFVLSACLAWLVPRASAALPQAEVAANR